MIVPPLLHLVAVNRLVTHLSEKRSTYINPPVILLAEEVDAWLTRLPWPWRTTCLKRATILYALLRRAGEDVQLHIGVKRETGKAITAHAWLMRNGAPYLEPPASPYATYQVITAFPELASTS